MPLSTRVSPTTRSAKRSLTGRLVAGLAAASALVLGGCQQVELLRLYHANNRTESRVDGALPLSLPFRDVDGWVLVHGSVNGKDPVPFVLDTGAPVVVLIDGPETAHLGLDISKARRLGAEDNLAAPTAAPHFGMSLRFGALELVDQTVLAMPLASLNCRGGPAPEVPFQGVIGYDLLRRFVVEVDYDAATLTLHDPASFPEVADGVVLPFSLIRRQPYVDVEVHTPDAPTYPARLHVDSGAAVSLTLFPGTRPEIQAPPVGRETDACFAGGAARYRQGADVQLALDNQPLGSTPAAYSIGGEVKESSQNGRLGARFLGRYNVVYDYPRERILLRPRRAMADSSLTTVMASAH